MITIQQVMELDLNRGVTAQQAEDILAGIDQQALYDEAKSMYVFEVWDKASPINGCAPEVVLEQEPGMADDPTAEWGLIKDAAAGAVIYLQAHSPLSPGRVKMRKAGNLTGEANEVDVDVVMAAHLHNIAASKADERALAMAREQVLLLPDKMQEMRAQFEDTQSLMDIILGVR